jgi:hypothetical protein
MLGNANRSNFQPNGIDNKPLQSSGTRGLALPLTVSSLFNRTCRRLNGALSDMGDGQRCSLLAIRNLLDIVDISDATLMLLRCAVVCDWRFGIGLALMAASCDAIRNRRRSGRVGWIVQILRKDIWHVLRREWNREPVFDMAVLLGSRFHPRLRCY